MMADTSRTLTRSVLLEVVVDTAADLRVASENGADRIELCAALSEGGLTPSLGLMTLAAELDVPVRVMIRPRAGDFTYTIDERHLMRLDISAVAGCGLEGVVMGANLADGRLDTELLQDLVSHAKAHDLSICLHRSFDLAPDAVEALELAIALGIDTILTSGGGNTAADGAPGLSQLVKQANGRIEILAGKGITAENVSAILASGVPAVHASCSQPLPLRQDRAAALGYVNASQSGTSAQAVAHLKSLLSGGTA
ncbi:hypothetical protein AEAC466_18795 [Asticcacaulis sp. AC466]|uniref:copper homeostasis protein CutC n=1 Tax=Asticcacaulis sp. AC466 TaxID=1282362 RepID=UPI0003C3F9B4|nr:copper homeostasis protein CutC [Asticcacaulis sp. AC466]ESQ82186.1 hypothetical protein AEAC466_18795 [Asticcacaulis sp. AC466]